MSALIHSEEEWLSLRPLIENLYSERCFTVGQVSDHLCGIGFQVKNRMVKTRLLNWDLHKNLRIREVRTALALLGPDRSTWPSQEPQFRIHRKVVNYDELVRFCRRKGIRDPLEWIQTTRSDDFRRSPHVELFSLSSNHSLGSSGASLETNLDPVFSARQTQFCRLRDPEIYVLAAAAVGQMRSYCLNYISSPISLSHKEPDVHQFTTHARFYDQIQEGLALLVKGNMIAAFVKFEAAFSLLKDLLGDISPMAMAIYLQILCALKTKKVETLALAMLRHTIEIAETVPTVAPSLSELLKSIQRSNEFLELPLLCLRVASETFDTKAPMEWKALYLQERHCDALYQAEIFNEGALRRAKLFTVQEKFYGASARNVLWTSMNVADDHLTFRRLTEAEKQFSDVLDKSSQLTGFNRAKIRVVALEGLAKTSMVKAGEVSGERSGVNAQKSNLETDRLLLGRALSQVNEALDLAQIWFETSSRRVQRVRDLREEVFRYGFLSRQPS